ncbi:C40 family peptidase [Bifidobacterium sp. 82T10]|uniref:C40 family peptidase n=1 Tax=Bifidobacterium miconis TaxID=2834435 RepID=A0ABS6WHZ4_9BIFI|nr:C40 family peptidase [Bifidobacterium miconis]MBW3093661.1 C40 family peptidase [Bifidobacterium miconis]
MNISRKVSIIAVTAVASCTLALAVVPGAEAADSGTVTSSRSFPKVQVVRKDLLSESASTSVDNDTNWGGVESLNVPVTKSKAEKDAEAAKKKAEEEAKAAAEAQAQSESQTDSQAASRSEQRDSLYDAVPDTNTAATADATATTDGTAGASTDTTNGTTADATGTTSVPASASGSALASYATQFVGSPYAAGGNTPSGWDCSGFVQYVYAQFGISLPHYSGAQAAVGTAVASIADAQPGDILANETHSAIYIGNGLVVNALNPYQGTQITGLSVFTSGYSIRRVL